MSMKTILFLLLAGMPVAAANDAGETVHVAFAIENAAGEPVQSVRQGETLHFVFRVQNSGAAAVRLASTFPPHDVAVLRAADNDPAWQAWSGRMFPQVMRVQELAPGESAEFVIEWRLAANGGEPLPAGNYLVRPAFRAFIGDRAIAFDAQLREITIE